MSGLQIVLLIGGIAVFILSYIIPEKKGNAPAVTKAVAKEEIKKMVSDEMETIKDQVNSAVDEAMEYAMEKTERSLERLSNEKIMAVNEYSDTVLQEIHKNHEEVMFLYDMLNDKHTNIKNTVSEVNKTVKEAAETSKEVEAVVNSFQRLTPEPIADTEKEIIQPEPADLEISFVEEKDEQGRNSNDRILELYKEGKSKVAIAKELGLGVGEVKLVIDLYKNM
ncbi:MAG: hypothetical protein K6G30_11325 [Acetatifactor sp.]|jgi:F0F1-type ATP synthase membrane subunit b/b'|nr:hypothetical protein [Acetatifactor sp.]